MSLILLTLLVLTKPDPGLTPGVVRPLTVQQICAVKWGRDRRAVTVKMKQQVAQAYGLDWRQRRFVEFDHLIPRELGGADEVQNLWPEILSDAHVKDRRENALHAAVCAGTISLLDAQAEMRAWGR